MSKRDKDKLTFLYLNARSVANKMDELTAIVNLWEPDVVGVTESWANENNFDTEYELEGYRMFRHDRPSVIEEAEYCCMQEMRWSRSKLFQGPSIRSIVGAKSMA
jgi:hypothetical protein